MSLLEEPTHAFSGIEWLNVLDLHGFFVTQFLGGNMLFNEQISQLSTKSIRCQYGCNLAALHDVVHSIRPAHYVGQRLHMLTRVLICKFDVCRHYCNRKEKQFASAQAAHGLGCRGRLCQAALAHSRCAIGECHIAWWTRWVVTGSGHVLHQGRVDHRMPPCLVS